MSKPLLVFDGDCSICRRSVDTLVRRRWIAREDTIAFQELPDEHVEPVWSAGIHNELGAVDPATGEVRSGVRALAWALRQGERAAALGRFLEHPLVLPFARPIYRTISYNRRILAPVANTGLICACDPDFRLRWRFALLAVMALLIALLVYVAGTSIDLRAADGRVLVSGPRDVFALTVVGWAMWLALAGAQLGLQKFTDLVGHTSMAMALGLVVFLPAALAGFVLAPGVLLGVQALFALVAGGLVASSLRKRLASLELRTSWVAAWAVCVGAGPLLGLFLLGRW